MPVCWNESRRRRCASIVGSRRAFARLLPVAGAIGIALALLHVGECTRGRGCSHDGRGRAHARRLQSQLFQRKRLAAVRNASRVRAPYLCAVALANATARYAGATVSACVCMSTRAGASEESVLG